jgi:hypothetical protein
VTRDWKFLEGKTLESLWRCGLQNYYGNTSNLRLLQPQCNRNCSIQHLGLYVIRRWIYSNLRKMLYCRNVDEYESCVFLGYYRGGTGRFSWNVGKELPLHAAS